MKQIPYTPKMQDHLDRISELMEDPMVQNLVAGGVAFGRAQGPDEKSKIAPQLEGVGMLAMYVLNSKMKDGARLDGMSRLLGDLMTLAVLYGFNVVLGADDEKPEGKPEPDAEPSMKRQVRDMLGIPDDIEVNIIDLDALRNASKN